MLIYIKYGEIKKIHGKSYKILPLAHPRQIGALGGHSESWYCNMGTVLLLYSVKT
jgi:hypothetical protein